MINVKRVYDPPGADDGARYLVERLWPRGISKENLVMDAWLKDVAPSHALRRWFRHDPSKWDDFQHLYRAELDANPSAWEPLVEALIKGNVTLLYSARDSVHNNVIVLKSYLEDHLAV